MAQNFIRICLVILTGCALTFCSGGKSGDGDEGAASGNENAEGGGGDGDANDTEAEEADTNSSLTSDGTYITAKTESYYDGDGNYEYIATTTYLDSNLEHALSKTYDTNADGTIDSTSTWTYNASGDVESTTYTDENGELTTGQYTYDSQGNLVAMTYDDGNDGSVDYVSTYTYDSQGNLLTRADDTNADGDVDSNWTFTYDSQGNVLTESRYEDDDSLGELVTKTYDTQGNVLTQSTDENGNGVWNEVSTMTYDTANNLLTQLDTYVDDYTDDILDTWETFTRTYTYDSNNNLVTQTWVWEDDEGEDLSEWYRHEYDSNQNLTKTYYAEDYAYGSRDASDGYTLYKEYTYDSNGNMLSIISYSPTGSGRQNYLYVYTYDTYGNILTSIAYQYDTDTGVRYFEGIGDPNNTTYTYSDGLTTAAEDFDGDGSPAGIDCNENNATIRLGAAELMDGLDNDCDLLVDEVVVAPDEETDPTFTYYADTDGDGYGNPANSTTATTAPSGYVTNNTDCDDATAATYPSNVEICDELDNDCDSSIDEGVQTTFYQDSDGDTYGSMTVSTPACSAPAGYVTDSGDCNDANGAIHPGVPDCGTSGRFNVSNNINNDCDGSVDEDAC